MERKPYKVIGGMLSVAGALFLAGCGHNTGSFTVGTRVNFGLDPQNATANVSYVDGLNVIDVSRENSSWILEIDSDSGVSVDSTAGTIKGVKRIRREVGPQITGYLVELAGKDMELAREYVKSVKYYWLYQAGKSAEESAATAETASVGVSKTETTTVNEAAQETEETTKTAE